MIFLEIILRKKCQQPCLLEHFTNQKFVFRKKKGPHTLYYLKYGGTPYVNITFKYNNK